MKKILAITFMLSFAVGCTDCDQSRYQYLKERDCLSLVPDDANAGQREQIIRACLCEGEK